MRSERRRAAAAVAAAALALLAWACADAALPVPDPATPEGVRAAATGLRSVRLEWRRGAGADLVAYRIERRTDLNGDFQPLVELSVSQLPAGETVAWFDTDVVPDTDYGYRISAVSRLEGRSTWSVVAGARTPPWPGVEVIVATRAPSAAASDADGYTLRVTGPDTVSGAVGTDGRARFSPLRPGAYTVALEGVRASCAPGPAATLPATVVDTGTTTVAVLRFTVVCRDPSRGALTVTVAAAGDSLDADGYRLAVTGLADDNTLPDTARIFARSTSLPSPAGGTARYDDLRPGLYEVELQGVAGNCAVAGSRRREADVEALDTDSIGFQVRCEGPPPDPTRPLVLRSAWTPRTAAPGAVVRLDVDLDLRGIAGQTVAGAQGATEFPAAVLRYDSARGGALGTPTINAAVPGRVTWLALTTGAPPAGAVRAAQLFFTVVGSAGSTAVSRTRDLSVVAGDGETQLRDLFRVQEDTLAVGAGAPNQPPVARANGPYAGTAGAPIAFSAAGSSDPDGTIASHRWSFGDGGTAEGASVSHAYAAPGTYTATLTVTDDDGATATATAAVTVSAGGGGTPNQPPVARANGPYAGTAGAAIAFSAAGSSDPDGTIASYRWSFGDGATATGASVTHAYAAPGSFPVTLTVTDDRGAASTDNTTATIAAAPGGNRPIVWTNAFGPINPADSLVAMTIVLDLSTDLPETAGPETLGTWYVDSLTWDPAVLRFHSFNWGPNGNGSINFTATSRGRLDFGGTQPAGNDRGTILLATIRFRVIGPAGRLTTTRTALGRLSATSALGQFDYRERARVVEGTVGRPAASRRRP